MLKEYWKDIYRAYRIARDEDSHIHSDIFGAVFDGMDKVDPLSGRYKGYILRMQEYKRAPKFLWVHSNDGRNTQRYSSAPYYGERWNCKCTSIPIQTIVVE